jgi:hypothetical protein
MGDGEVFLLRNTVAGVTQDLDHPPRRRLAEGVLVRSGNLLARVLENAVAAPAVRSMLRGLDAAVIEWTRIESG